MKRLLCLTLSLVMLLCTACGSAPEQNPSDAPETATTEPAAYTFTDDLGRSVTVDHPKRTAVLLGSFVDAWLLAGGTVCAAPHDAWEDYDFSLPDDVTDLGGTKELSLEQLLGSEPDFIIASASSSQHMEWKETLEGTGIPTAYFNVNRFEDFLRVLKIFTDITGQPERYEKYGTSQEAAIQKVLDDSAQQPREKVLLLRASAAKILAKNNHDNVAGEMLADLNCDNIADSDDSLLEDLNIEHILLEDPAHIFIVEVGSAPEEIHASVEKLFEENPLRQQLTAVKTGNVHFLEKHLYNMKPNAHWAEAYAQLAETLHEAP